MKSRLLSIATVFTLLLGLVSTNLFGQITNTASVEFMVRSYDQAGDMVLGGTGPNGFQLSSAGLDTVGRQMDVAVRWEAPSQFLTQVTYTITLPKGTVLEEDVKSNVVINYKDRTTDVNYAVPSTNVAIDGNSVASYSSTKAPSVVVTDINTFGVAEGPKTVTVSLLGGIFVGKSLSDINSETGGKMNFSLEHGASAGTVISNITGFYAVNDLVAGVQVNTDVDGYIDQAANWSNIDSLFFVDRFGNKVPDFMSGVAGIGNEDTLVISVPEGAGQFADSTEAAVPTAGTLAPVTNNYMAYDADSIEITLSSGGTSDGAKPAANSIYQLDATAKSMVIFLGAKPTAGTGALGLTFDAPSGATETAFTFEVVGPRVNSGTVLEVEATTTTEVTRAILPASAAKTIGSLVLTTDIAGTNYNGQALGGNFTLTLKNIFGEAFTGGVIGTISDSVQLSFAYRKGTEDEGEWTYAIDEALTGLLSSGGAVTSMYTRPAAVLVEGNISDDLVVSGATLTDGVATLTAPAYLGTTSHPEGDSIFVIATAFNNTAKTDSVLIKVEPNVPVAFDLDTLAANLEIANAVGHIVEGMPIAIEMPIFALDTAYNRVSNLNLADNALFLDDVTIQGVATDGINLLIDGRDPVGYTSGTVKDSIRFVTIVKAATPGRPDSSYIFNLDVERTDSSRINLGGVGIDSLGLSLLYSAGINYKLSIVWNPGTVGGFAAVDFTERTIDLGLFNITGIATTDSVRSIAVENAAVMQDDTLDLLVSFVLPKDPFNSIGPNLDTKQLLINILGLPDGGIAAGIAKESVKVSTDNVNFYPALGVTQGAEVKDSLWIATPIELNSVLADLKVYVKIMDFIAPADTGTFGIQMVTDATPVSATNLEALTVELSGPAPGEASDFDFVTVPDSLTADTTNAQDIQIDVTDADSLKKVYLNVYESLLTVNATTGAFEESDPVLTMDSLVYTTSLPVAVEVTKSIAKKALGTKIAFDLVAIDAGDDTVTSATKFFLIAPKRGKRNLTPTATNVADVMRCAYLVAEKATPKLIDWFGLDLDQSGDFDYPDIDAVLAIFHGTGTLLASASEELASDVKVELSYEAVDKTNANLMVNLVNNGNLNMGVFRLKYDPEKYILGEASAADRLKDLTVISNNNEAEGEYTVVVINVNGRPIVSGTGSILTIPVSSVGEKFDGVGEISLLNAGFEQGVNVELSREALALKAVLPKAFALSQNFPNPFNPSTTIAFDIPEGKEINVRLNVYNMRGQLIRSLVNEVKSEGSYQIQWDGADNHGRRVSSGVYFYRIVTGEFSQTRKMVILK